MNKKTDLSKQVARWRAPGATGFFAFLADVRPMIPSEKGPLQPYELPSERVKAEITAALDGDFSTIVWCWPRRHGKTVVSALVIIWRFLTRQNQTAGIIANSATQTTDTAFRLVKTILEGTTYTKVLIDTGAIIIGADNIAYSALGSRIQGFPSNPAALFGKKLSLCQVSELHAAKSDAAFQAMASAVIDSEDGTVLVDSTTGPRSSPLFHLYQLWENKADPALYFSHIAYSDLDDAIKNGPPWIAEKKLRSRHAQMMDLEFCQQHLNRWGDSSALVFPSAVLETCTDATYPLDVKALADGRAWVAGAGLDRAQGLGLADSTVTCAVVKIIDADELPHIFALASDTIFGNSGASIKRHLTAYHRNFGVRKATLEAVNVSDIQAWAAEQPFDSEVVHPTREKQAAAFLELHAVAKEGRLHIHPKFSKLLKEMGTFEYRMEANGSRGTIPVFEHAKGCHDDAVYALAWAVYSLREVELSPFELPGIHCDAIGPAARLCLLNGGCVIPPCSDSCRSMIEVQRLYEKYSSRAGCSKMSILHFFEGKVTNTGSHTVRR